ncbi:hypothetical protein LTR67_002075 [Exophiala xenobiotica]
MATRKSRSRGLRAKTGCLTCRKRHLKCDEVKPSCGLCAKSGRTCTYLEPSTRRVNTASNTEGEEVDESMRSPSTTSNASVSYMEGGAETRPESLWRNTFDRGQDGDGNPASSENPEEVLQPSANDVQGMAPQQEYHTQPGSAHLAPQDNNEHLGRTFQHQPFQAAEYTGPSPDTATEFSHGSLVDVATARWFGMLASDAEIGITSPKELAPFQNQYPTSASLFEGTNSWTTAVDGSLAANTNDEVGWATQRIPGLSPLAAGQDGLECAMWKSASALTLKRHEQHLLEVFVNRISQWMDLFDPFRHFCTLVPRLALFNVGLLSAVLALSVRYLTLNPALANGTDHQRHDALRYYHQSLHYVQNAMQYSSYLTSLELLATTLIISAYEMLDGSRKDWERHLQGVFGIQRSQVIHGDTGGLRAAVWWAWLQQDVWGAFREKRKVFTFWRPVKTFSDLNTWELAARSVFLMAKVVNYCSEVENSGEDNNIQSRIDAADRLSLILDDWERHLPIEFTPLPLGDTNPTSVFKPCWIQPAALGAAMQIYNAARILLTLHRPLPGGLNGFMKRQKHLDRYVEAVGGIAVALTDYGSSVISSQCLFIAGMCTSDDRKRTEIRRLMALCRQKTGWPVKPMDNDLRAIWDSPDTM